MLVTDETDDGPAVDYTLDRCWSPSAVDIRSLKCSITVWACIRILSWYLRGSGVSSAELIEELLALLVGSNLVRDCCSLAWNSRSLAEVLVCEEDAVVRSVPRHCLYGLCTPLVLILSKAFDGDTGAKNRLHLTVTDPPWPAPVRNMVVIAPITGVTGVLVV